MDGAARVITKPAIMKAVRFNRFGDPKEVLHIQELPIPQPNPGQVRVRMIASPINPSDLLVVRGAYGRLPQLPATPGFEGVGIVEASGGGILGRLRLGRHVAVLNGLGGNWQEYVVLTAKQVVPIPKEFPDDQAACFFVNPASALAMTEIICKIPRGSWLMQTAAGSALGRMIIRLGKAKGFRTINIVRRLDLADDLRRLGGDAIICTANESIEERVKAITGETGVRFGLDAVGGETGSAVLRALAPGGRLLVYGNLSGQPIAIDPRVVIVGDKRVEGFWLSHWVGKQNPLTMLGMFRKLRRLMASGILTTDVTAAFPLEEIQSAVRQAETPGRGGKILLRMPSH
jgi:NADPH:quinone reductase-like Zn-dependent oxidoreductase